MELKFQRYNFNFGTESAETDSTRASVGGVFFWNGHWPERLKLCSRVHLRTIYVTLTQQSKDTIHPRTGRGSTSIPTRWLPIRSATGSEGYR